jgi:GNAT superfamily N-acetyltransferase
MVEDAATCGAICRAADAATSDRRGISADVADRGAVVERLAARFARSDVYSVVAEVGGRVVGFVGLSSHWPVAGVFPPAVDPDAGGAALGRLLMEHALSWAWDWYFAGVRVVQDASDLTSLALFTGLGFEVREPLLLLRAPAHRTVVTATAVRLATDRDLEACERLCMRIHGFDRGPELQAGIRRGTATLAESGGRITGYATSLGCSGHAVALDNAALIGLIGGATTIEEAGLLIPTRNRELLRWCLESGLRAERPMQLLSVGLYRKPAGAFLPSILY